MQTAPHSDLRADSPAGVLEALADAKRFNQWMADTVAPFIGTDVLELGAGIGNLTALLSSGRRRYVAADINPEYLAHLKMLLQNRPNLSIALIAAGFRIERLLTFNRATYPAWFLNSRLLRAKKLSRTQLRAFDFLVPLWRRIDHLLVWPPTSLIGIGVRNDR